MQFPQRVAPRSARQRTRRKGETAATVVVGSTYHVRKSRSRWNGDVVDAMELAAAPWEPTAQLNSLLNVENISTMQEIYPSVAVEVLEDVLVAAEFRVDVAVAMLTELVREQQQVAEMGDPDVADMVIIDSYLLDENSETQWHDVAASRPELQQWVVVQDDWEVVDSGHTDHPKESTFADIVRRIPHDDPDVFKQQQVRPASHSSNARPRPSSVVSSLRDEALTDPEELSVKSFGTRKRHALRKPRA